MHKYVGNKTTQIMMAIVRQVTSLSELWKFQADGFLLDWVYVISINAKLLIKLSNIIIYKRREEI